LFGGRGSGSVCDRWRVAAAERKQEAQGGAEFARVAGVEAAESGEDNGVGFGGVRHGEVIDVLVGHEHVAVGVSGDERLEGAVLVLEDGLFHERDTKGSPFGEGEFIDEVALGEVAGLEVGAGFEDEVAKKVEAFCADGEEADFAKDGFS